MKNTTVQNIQERHHSVAVVGLNERDQQQYGIPATMVAFIDDFISTLFPNLPMGRKIRYESGDS